MKDLHLFARKLIFKRFFHIKNSQGIVTTRTEQEALASLEALIEEQLTPDTGRFPTHLLLPSKKFPPLTIHSNIEIFVKMVCSLFKKIDCNIQLDNITNKHRQIIKELQRMKDVVIKPLDKGGNIVIWPTKLYEREALRQLCDSKSQKT